MITPLPFVDRPPTSSELERIRLILSTYQDGSGMLVRKDGGTLPGWRDFERTVAAAFGGLAQESKALFDVVLSAPPAERRPRYGLSCKMRRELNRIKRDGRATIEVSNAAGEFWDALDAQGVNKANYSANAAVAGRAVMSVVDRWHEAVGVKAGGFFDVEKSTYLVLLWNAALDYQLFQFPLKLVDPAKLNWSVPKSKSDTGKDSRRLCGDDGTGYVVEWYGNSGGQLKLYPPVSKAVWKSPVFQLEPLPPGDRTSASKAASYFPAKWRATV